MITQLKVIHTICRNDSLGDSDKVIGSLGWFEAFSFQIWHALYIYSYEYHLFMLVHYVDLLVLVFVYIYSVNSEMLLKGRLFFYVLSMMIQ